MNATADQAKSKYSGNVALENAVISVSSCVHVYGGNVRDEAVTALALQDIGGRDAEWRCGYAIKQLLDQIEALLAELSKRRDEVRAAMNAGPEK